MSPELTPQEVYATQYRALRGSLLRYLRKQVSDPAVAEDLLHEVFVKAIAAGERGELPHNLAGWLYRIARNGVIDWYRAKRPFDALPDDLESESSDEDPTPLALSKCLRPMTEQLPPIYRDTLLAMDFQGRTARDLATEAGLSLSAIKSRASRGRRMLKQRLLACCRVELSATGGVMDFHQQESRPGATICNCGNP